MQVDLRQPLIQGSDKEQLAQIRSYLFQLREQLQWAFENVESSDSKGAEKTTVIQQNTTQTVTRPPTSEEAEATFSAIKNLIIKSADIVDAYYENINQRLTSIYVAQGDYGEFKEEVTASVTANANNIIMEQQKIETLSQVYQNKENAAVIAKSSGFIKTGFLGDSKYGVEIGQRTETESGEQLRGSARFVTDGIEFDDENGTKSAWLTKNRLHANEVEVGQKQQLGGFVDEVDPLTKDVTTKWVGVKEV
jgi:hypothetical protein